MNLSYRDIDVRDYCYSQNPDLSNTRFTISEIVSIRAYIADLRAAPSLVDVPFRYQLVVESENQKRFFIQFGCIRIICEIISTLKKPSLSQIKRVKILDIIRIDLHLADSKVNSI